MERKSWTVDTGGTEHVVALDWTYWGGHREVSVDGQVVGTSTIPLRGRSKQAFVLDGHPAVVTTRPNRAISGYFRIERHVDGRPVPPDPGRKAFWEA